MKHPAFEAAHEQFISDHVDQRNGERRGRLVRGHRHAEKLLLEQVWWPLFGSFEHLHPEYEVADWNRKSQFLDFAFLPPNGRFGIECDGYQSHVKDMDRDRFSYSLNRDTYLTGMGWKMIHLSYDDVQNRPELCRMLLQLVIGPHMLRTFDIDTNSLTPMEKEVLRFAWKSGASIRTTEISRHFDLNYRTVRKPLERLSSLHLLEPVRRGRYVVGYTATEKALEFLL